MQSREASGDERNIPANDLAALLDDVESAPQWPGGHSEILRGKGPRAAEKKSVDPPPNLATVPRFIPMHHPIRISLWISLFGLLTLGALQGSDSLYNRTEARSLTPEEATRFGPDAGSHRYDSRMINAARIAQARAKSRSTSRCWRYVKQALLAAGVVDSYPTTVYAKQAAQELPESFGFKKLRSRDPHKAPVGSVLVYGGKDAGHVEIRTATGYVSDFSSRTPYTKRPLIGIFVKPRA